MFAPAAVGALLGSVQDVQSRFHGANQLVPAVSPHGPLLWVSGEPRLQLVDPKMEQQRKSMETVLLIYCTHNKCSLQLRTAPAPHLRSVNMSKGITSYSLDNFTPELTSARFSWERKNS